MGRFSIFNKVKGGYFIPLCFYNLNEPSSALLKRNIFSECIKSENVLGLGRHILYQPVGHTKFFFNAQEQQFNPFTTKQHVMMGQHTNRNSACWNCGKNVQSLFCEFCKSLQAVNKTEDFFQILGVERSYKFELSDLRHKFRKLQALLHPDKFSSKSKKEQELSEEFSSAVNKAFSTLSNPLERGLYLLSLHNMSIQEENTDVDKVFLMEIMERNEEIENESDPQKLNEFNSNNKEKLSELVKKITEAFESDNLELAKKLLTEMKYYNSIDTKIKEVKQNLNIPD